MFSFNFDFATSQTSLCLMGAQNDTHNTSQRKETSIIRQSKAITNFYHSLFRTSKDKKLKIAQLGVKNSLLMWRDFFIDSEIDGFDPNPHIRNDFIKRHDNQRIEIHDINLLDDENVYQSLSNKEYDLIIDDLNLNLLDQIRFIYNALPNLKAGGMLVIENIFLDYKEDSYLRRLKEIADEFTNIYFAKISHDKSLQVGWNNEKVMVLVKGGADPIFKSDKKITVITPSCRPENLLKLKDSINFEYLDEWIIVYDQSKVPQNPVQFGEDPKIKEYIFEGEGISGNPQRNYALDRVSNKDTYLYFLDDDNTICPDLYKLIEILDDGFIYTFNQKDGLEGNVCEVLYIDSAMTVIDFKLCPNLRWKNDVYSADGIYIQQCYEANKDRWIYLDNDLAFYNSLNEKTEK